MSSFEDMSGRPTATLAVPHGCSRRTALTGPPPTRIALSATGWSRRVRTAFDTRCLRAAERRVKWDGRAVRRRDGDDRAIQNRITHCACVLLYSYSHRQRRETKWVCHTCQNRSRTTVQQMRYWLVSRLLLFCGSFVISNIFKSKKAYSLSALKMTFCLPSWKCTSTSKIFLYLMAFIVLLMST